MKATALSTKVSVFIATSLDGYIAKNDGSIDWLMKANNLLPAGEDGGYKAFIATVDTLVMGRHSYEKVLSFNEWPYSRLPVIVMSSQTIDIPEHLQDIVSVSKQNPIALMQELNNNGVLHVYVDGGITIQGFLQNRLINEITITFVPIILGEGKSLFGSLEHEIDLQLISINPLSGGFVQVKYEVRPGF